MPQIDKLERGPLSVHDLLLSHVCNVRCPTPVGYVYHMFLFISTAALKYWGDTGFDLLLAPSLSFIQFLCFTILDPFVTTFGSDAALLKSSYPCLPEL